MPINLDFVNGYLEAMRCLNTGLNHGCYFFMQLLVYKGNFSNTLKHYYESIKDAKGKYYKADFWHIVTKQITVENFTQKLTESFFQLSYSAKVNNLNCSAAIDGFIHVLHPIELQKCYLYMIETTPPIWYAIQWYDLVIVYQNEHCLLHLELDD